MRRPLFPKWFYTTSVGSAMWILVAWLTFRTLDAVFALQHPGAGIVTYLVLQVVFLAILTYAIVAAGDKGAQAQEAPRPVLRKWRERAYLVVHLDLRVSPPVAIFVHAYSCKAKDLTHVGLPEARADLYMVEADTFQEALDEMERLQPLYFPWATPLMTRNR